MAFKASTQSQKDNLSFGKGKAEGADDDTVGKSGVSTPAVMGMEMGMGMASHISIAIGFL